MLAGLMVSYQNEGQKELKWQLQVGNLAEEEKGVAIGIIKEFYML